MAAMGTSAPPRKNARGSNAKRKGTPRSSQPAIRGPVVRVAKPAAAALRAGHPWVFGESMLRPLEAELGAVVRVCDDEGGHVGWALADGDGAIAARMITRSQRAQWDSRIIDRHVQACVERRQGWAALADEDAHRVIAGDSEGLPGVAVDRYADYLLVYSYSPAVDTYLQPLLDSLVAHCNPRGIYLQERWRPVTPDAAKGGARHVRGETAPVTTEVTEDGLTFLVDLTAPVSPGLFIDLREGRRLCETVAHGRTVLNLFSFTGAFALRCIRAGARSVANVDAAAKAHARCRQNLAASGLDPESCEPLTGDVFKHLEKLRQRKRQFDLVIVDPPPYSQVRGTRFSAQRDWHDLMRAVAGVTSPGGLVLAVSNAQRLSDAEFLTSLGSGTHAEGRELRLLEERGLPWDFAVQPAFSQGRYLKIKLLTVG